MDEDAPHVERLEYRVVIDRRPWEQRSREELEAAARETMDEILAITQPDFRERIRAMLEHRYEDAGWPAPAPNVARMVMPVSSTNPEMARLWGKFESIRRVMQIEPFDEQA